MVPKQPPPSSDPTATRFTYYAGATRLPETAAPAIKNRSWTITANVKTEGAKRSGVIVAVGGVSSGITLYLKNGVPIFDYNYYGEHTVLKAPNVLAAGDATIEVDFSYGNGGVTLTRTDSREASGVIRILTHGENVGAT